MADSKSGRAKRRVKNPETFRERAVKAGEASDQPKKAAKLKKAAAKPVNAISRPVRQASKKASQFRVVRWLGKLLRFIGKIVFPVYFRRAWQELKLVTWPSWKESRQLTFAVIVFAAIFGAAIAAVDYGLDKVFRNILLK